MEIARVIVKIVMWVLIIGFGSNYLMQTISYSFYKNAKQMKGFTVAPQYIIVNENLSGYGYHMEEKKDQVILFFGGSNYIAYNSVGSFAQMFECPFVAADYYGTQGSKGKMNLASMQKTAIDLYEWTKQNYQEKRIIVMGHSYGTGIATYLASERVCDELILLSAYRDIADLYNKILPIFWGPAKIFLSNNIRLEEYAKKVTCATYIIGSKADKTLGASLQNRVKDCFFNAQIRIFDEVSHEDYLKKEEVISYIRSIIF